MTTTEQLLAQIEERAETDVADALTHFRAFRDLAELQRLLDHADRPVLAEKVRKAKLKELTAIHVIASAASK